MIYSRMGLLNGHRYGLNSVTSRFICWSLKGGEGSEVIQVSLNSIWLGSFKEEARTQTHAEGRWREHPGRKEPSARQGERPLEKSGLPTPRSLPFSLQHCEGIHVWCLSPQSVALCHDNPRKLIQEARATLRLHRDQQLNLLGNHFYTWSKEKLPRGMENYPLPAVTRITLPPSDNAAKK